LYSLSDQKQPFRPFSQDSSIFKSAKNIEYDDSFGTLLSGVAKFFDPPKGVFQMIRALAFASLLTVSAITTSSLLAQEVPINTLASFNGTNGLNPIASLTLSGSTLYGTTPSGGSSSSDGEVFSVPVAGGAVKVLAPFDGSDGEGPEGGLLLINNLLVGTTVVGGTYGSGTVFYVPTSGASPTVITSLQGFTAAGGNPRCNLVYSGGFVYGTSQNGGVGVGSVFSVNLNTGANAEVAAVPGFAANQGLLLSGSTFYGTTAGGSAYDSGTIYSVPLAGGTAKTLGSFPVISSFALNLSSLILVNGTLYGETQAGGANGDGAIFSIPATGGTPTVIASFNGADGGTPIGGLTLAGSLLYGAAENGGDNGDGAIFSIPLTGGTPTLVASFDGTDGAFPEAGLILSNNTLYGTTAEGGSTFGAISAGTVFSVAIPEPATIGILGFAGLCLMRRRRSL
jgi:uncharacterized repeat protein (TIGR03803 family)